MAIKVNAQLVETGIAEPIALEERRADHEVVHGPESEGSNMCGVNMGPGGSEVRNMRDDYAGRPKNSMDLRDQTGKVSHVLENLICINGVKLLVANRKGMVQISDDVHAWMEG